MLGYFVLLWFSLGPAELVHHPSRQRQGYNAGVSPLRVSLEVHGLSRYPQGPPSREVEEEVQVRGPSPIRSTHPAGEEAEADTPNQRTGNWCSVLHSRLVTFVASCKTEKYVMHSQQACPNGMSECQKVMYRVALKPVYQVKQKVLTSVDWKCCPGFTGRNCQHNDPNAIPIPVIHITGSEDGSENHFPEGTTTTPALESTELFKTIQEQESTLVDLQNDVLQATTSLVDLERILNSNITSSVEMNQTNPEFQERLLQQVLLPYVKSFLREHLRPVWASFNKSLQNLAHTVQNLSENVELNRKNIEKFYVSSAPKKDLQELGTKFESKIQENVVRLDQLKRDMDNNYHAQQAAIHNNLTMLKADTDLKVKRHHKIQLSQLAGLNNSIEDLRRGQENLQDDIQALNRNITELWLYCDTKVDSSQENIRHLTETVEGHLQQLKDLDKETTEAFASINTLETWYRELRTQFKNKTLELHISLIENGLTMEETKVAVQRQLMELNSTVINLQASNEDLLFYVKNCDCQKLTADLEILEADQRNLTANLKDIFQTLSELKQKEIYSQNALQNSVEDLSMALHTIQQTLVSQQEQNRKILQSVDQLSSQAKKFLEDVTLLKKVDENIHGDIKNLESSFSSLLQDAMRHEQALVALLGDELMEVISEEQPEALKMSIFQVHEVLMSTSKELGLQQASIESLKKRIQVLEMQSKTQSDSPESHKPSDFGKPTRSTTEEFKDKRINLEHMEPNHEAARIDQLDNPAYNDILALKKDVKLLGMEMKKLQLHWSESSFWCNESAVHLMGPLNNSVETLKADMVSLKHHFGEHLSLFKRLFRNSQELAASNTSLDFATIYSVLTKKLRKQQRMGEQHYKRDAKQAKDQRQSKPAFTENNLNSKLHKEGSSVAFYAGFSEGDHENTVLHFNELYLNYGNGYFLEDGRFKAPQQGVYVFIISVEFDTGPAMGQLIFGNQGKVPLHKRKGKEPNGDVTTSFALVELKEEEMVWFELVQGSIVKRSPPGTFMGGYLIFKT